MQYVIVGNGVAGVTAAQTIRERDDAAQILLLVQSVEIIGPRSWPGRCNPRGDNIRRS